MRRREVLVRGSKTATRRRVRVALAHRRQGHGHRGGMVGEILQDQHPVKFPGHLLALVDPFKAGQGLL